MRVGVKGRCHVGRYKNVTMHRHNQLCVTLNQQLACMSKCGFLRMLLDGYSVLQVGCSRTNYSKPASLARTRFSAWTSGVFACSA